MASRHRDMPGFLLGAFAGVMVAWLLFDWKSPSGIFILFCMALGGLLLRPRERREESPFPRRSEGRIASLSGILFMVFLVIGSLFLSPRVVPGQELGSALFVLCGGLSLLSGAPLMASLHGPLRLLWVACVSIGSVLVAFSVLSLTGVDLPPLGMLCLMALALLVPLAALLVAVRRRRAVLAAEAGEADPRCPEGLE
ncbi:hypothetical protein JW921_06070 [Candidatus Fermentibacterales bacterium]|nr:hypothetical protein [Candidatus Fermentibacterales bacterium]